MSHMKRERDNSSDSNQASSSNHPLESDVNNWGKEKEKTNCLFSLMNYVTGEEKQLYFEKKNVIHYSYVVRRNSNVTTKQITLDIKRKEVMHSEGYLCDSQEKQGEILYANGTRWEGGVANGVANGWGTLFSSQRKVLFDGFQLNGSYMCYGTLYDENGHLIYEGGYLDGKQFGYGHSQSDDGSSVFTNEKKEILITPNTEFDCFIYNTITKLTIEHNCGQSVLELCLNHYPNLEVFRMGNDCCQNVAHFQIRYCPSLKEIVIGCSSLVNTRSFWVACND